MSKKKRDKSKPARRRATVKVDAKTTREKSTVAPNLPQPPAEKTDRSNGAEISNATWYGLLAFVTVLFLWSYWPVLVELVGQWNRVADYSHGFLVAPIAIYMLWLTRDTFTRSAKTISWIGVTLLIIALAIRLAGSYLYLEALHGWSIPVWIAGVIWMFFGWKAFTWSLPAVGFLMFMVPLPYTIENMLGQPLQKVSTQISLFILQLLGQPALAEGTTITIGPHTLEIERACSGLRIFFGITALAYAFVVLFKRPFWTKLLLFLAILPITLLANSLRIVATAMLFQMGLDSMANHLGHDLAGWFMIPLAAAFFAITLAYLDKLFPMVSNIDPRHLVQRQSRRQASQPN